MNESDREAIEALQREFADLFVPWEDLHGQQVAAEFKRLRSELRRLEAERRQRDRR